MFYSLLRSLLFAAVAVPVLVHGSEVADLYEEALVQYQKEEIPTAIIHLKNALQKDPNFLSAHVLLGRAYLAQGEGAAAEKELLVADRLGGDRALIVVPLAQAYLLQDKYESLLERLKPEGLREDVRSELLVLRGQANLQLERIEQAELAFYEAARLAPEAPLPKLGQATVLLRRGDPAGAAEVAAKVSRLAPDEPEAWHLRGTIAHSQGDLDGAVGHFSRALELSPSHNAVLLARAGAYLEQGRKAPALKDILLLRKEFSKDPRAAYLHAVVLAKEEKAEEAKRALLDAASLIDGLSQEVLDDHPPSLILAGVVNYSLEQWEKAGRHLRRYLELNPGHPGARRLLGSMLLADNQTSKAIAVLEPALAAAPNDPRLLTSLGTAYMRSGKHLKAAELLERAASLAPDAEEAPLQHAVNNLAAGKDERAVEELADIFARTQGEARRSGLILAVLHYRRGEYESARRVAEELYWRDPDNITLLNLLASARMALGEYKKARIDYETVVAESPDFIPARINLAKLDLAEEKPEQAQRQLLAILESRPEHLQTMIELARVAESRGRTEEAIHWLEKARLVNTQSLAATLYLVDLRLRTGNAEAALELAREAEGAWPDNLKVLDGLGRSRAAAGQQTGAQVIYRRMSRIAGFDAGWLHRIARMQFEMEDLDGAVWSLRKATEGDPEFLPAQTALVEVLLAAGKAGKAKEQARLLRARYPERAVVYRLLGDVQLQTGEAREAIKNYLIALEKEPGPLLAIGLFQAYRVTGQEAEAMQFLTQWVASHPGDLDTKQALAESYLHQGRLAQAGALFEQILESRPDHPPVLNNLANIYGKTGDPKALEYARKAYGLVPDNAAVIDTLGWLLVLNGQPGEGLRYLRNAHARASADPLIRYHIGVALERLGRNEEARAELEQALGAEVEFDGVEEARAMLRELEERKRK